MKKIVFLINSLESGGAERVVSNLLNNLVEKYDCYLILIHNNIFYSIDDRVKIICLDEKKELTGIMKLLRLPILAYKLSKIIKENRFEKVVSFLTRANYINILSNIFTKHKTIINIRSTMSRYKTEGLSGKINLFLIKSLFNKSDLIISNSLGVDNDLKTFYVCRKTLKKIDILKLEIFQKRMIMVEVLLEKNIN
ncbi:hypothetical protein NG783_09605 [Aliarcobacter cryaerophilus]|uniref:hypothetical protein n=1 Tax=Aliarcobacter cryaerophilus TaxID=28198 RepID=UPI003DA55D7C